MKKLTNKDIIQLRLNWWIHVRNKLEEESKGFKVADRTVRELEAELAQLAPSPSTKENKTDAYTGKN